MHDRCGLSLSAILYIVKSESSISSPKNEAFGVQTAQSARENGGDKNELYVSLSVSFSSLSLLSIYSISHSSISSFLRAHMHTLIPPPPPPHPPYVSTDKL